MKAIRHEVWVYVPNCAPMSFSMKTRRAALAKHDEARKVWPNADVNVSACYADGSSATYLYTKGTAGGAS